MNVRNFKQKNTSLRINIAQLNTKLQCNTWRSFTNKQSLLIGDSLLRDIDEDKLHNTKVRCHSGATVKDITQHIATEVEKSATYDSVYVVVGTNDCDEKKNEESVQSILDEYKILIEKSKIVAENVIISSICPRLDEAKKHIDLLNAGLQTVCEDSNVDYVDQSPSFKLSDGSPNDGYLIKQGPHLTKSGTNKLVKNLNVSMKCDDVFQHRAAYKAAQKRHSWDTDSDISHVPGCQGGDAQQSYSSQSHTTRRPDWRKRPGHHGHQHGNGNQGRCAYCWEPGHDTRMCYHRKPITCNKCFETGHKEKFCHEIHMYDEHMPNHSMY